MTRLLLPVALVATLALSACGTESAGSGAGSTASTTTGNANPTGGTGSPSTSATTNPLPPLRAALATVLDAPGKGPQLCLGGVLTSLPPQCGGPVIDNWDWAKAPKHDSANGVRWGQYAVIGTYDAATSTFHLTKPVTTIEDYTGPRPRDPLTGQGPTTPCPAPAGGWKVLDPAKTTQEAEDATLAAAAALSTYAGAWLDQSINPADPAKEPEKMNDPAKLILNVKVIEAAAAAERTLRATWGGMLCVSEGGHTEAELLAIQEELSTNTIPGLLGSGVDTQLSVVELQVIDDLDGRLQAGMDKKYGPGVVSVTSALLPYAD